MQCCSNSPGPSYWDFPLPNKKLYRDLSWRAEDDASRLFDQEMKDWLDQHNFSYNGRFVHASTDLSQYGERVYSWRLMIRLYDSKAAVLYKLTWI